MNRLRLLPIEKPLSYTRAICSIILDDRRPVPRLARARRSARRSRSVGDPFRFHPRAHGSRPRGRLVAAGAAAPHSRAVGHGVGGCGGAVTVAGSPEMTLTSAAMRDNAAPR